MNPGGNRKSAAFPSRDALLDFIRESDKRVSKREIARAFNLDADQKVELKRVLKELEAEGEIGRGGKRRYEKPMTLPRVAVIEIAGTDTDGELLAKPQTWTYDVPPPTIYVAPERRGPAALGPGERVLARLTQVGPASYEARIIRRLQAAPPRALGIYREVDGQGRIKSIDKREKMEFLVPRGEDMGAAPGELVWAEVRRGRALGPKQARVVERLGDVKGPRSISLITIHDHDIPTKFSAEAWQHAEDAAAAPLDGRDDLRRVPLVTIDGADARDFDDAVWAAPDDAPDNAGGWHLIVAIADVAWYVRPGDPLDSNAFERGNSVYFPDRVVPMLPPALSNGWCSLVPDEDRPCLAAHLWIDRDGALVRHRFVRAVMRSAARLTYTQVQTAQDGNPDEHTAALAEPVIGPLFGAYQALAKARRQRGVLELDLPERQVVLAEDGGVAAIRKRSRFDSHKLIEEFMIAANVAAAETLEAARMPCMYRVHDQPSEAKLEALRAFLDSIGLKLARGQVIRATQFNRVLERAADTPYAHLVHEVVLRSQAQAAYSPENIGHFGLALRRYCHFTSPIRRYADLLVHRALIAGLRLGEGGLPKEPGDFEKLGEHISATERRAATAERDAVDRFTAHYLAAKVGATFSGRINGVTRFGLFITLDESGGDGLVPIRSLPDDYYVHDETRHSLVGRATGLTFRLGDPVEVRLVEADPITGGLILQLMHGGDIGPRKPHLSKGTSRRRQRS
ncbi:MAG: ribonuclease R [Rhodospirillales bacterium]|nr:MAG: ribonuclease R [Rhodospirillales bacterium]